MQKIVGKKGEKVIISGSYKCTEHANSWFSFNTNTTFPLCPRCRNEQKHENTWYSILRQSNNANRTRFSTFLSSLFSNF